MQKLQLELKNIPMDVSQVRSPISFELNRDESLSVQNIVLDCNTPEVNQSQHIERPLKSFVYVMSIEGTPLMPCLPAKAKRLLKKGAAKVIKRVPFAIQLNFKCENIIQPIVLGIDSGSKKIGFSAIENKKELFSGELSLDDKTSKRIMERKMYRKYRRNKKWYRESRFKNRKTKKGSLVPSVKRKCDAHLNLINKIKLLLPIHKINIEVGKFNIKPDGDFKIKKEKCQLCGKEFSKGSGHNIHHIIPKSKGGTNRSANLSFLHESCHKKIHNKNSLNSLNKSPQYKNETFMNILRCQIVSNFNNVVITFGHETSKKRTSLCIEKSHQNDAFVIAGAQKQTRCKQQNILQKRRNNRSLQLNRKGFKPAIRKEKYKIQPHDLVWIGGKIFSVKGTHHYGKRVVIDNGKSISIKKIEKHYSFGSFVWGC